MKTSSRNTCRTRTVKWESAHATAIRCDAPVRAKARENDNAPNFWRDRNVEKWKLGVATLCHIGQVHQRCNSALVWLKHATSCSLLVNTAAMADGSQWGTYTQGQVAIGVNTV